MIKPRLASPTGATCQPIKIMRSASAEKHGLSPTQIREPIARVGNDREKLGETAKQLRAQRT
jgi:hypothetical protein